MATLPCIVCGKKLESALNDVEHNQPSEGTTFQAGGQYGSTVWDPPPGVRISRYLEINICDDCLLRQQEVVLFTEVIPNPPTVEAKPWIPGEEQ